MGVFKSKDYGKISDFILYRQNWEIFPLLDRKKLSGYIKWRS